LLTSETRLLTDWKCLSRINYWSILSAVLYARNRRRFSQTVYRLCHLNRSPGIVYIFCVVDCLIDDCIIDDSVVDGFGSYPVVASGDWIMSVERYSGSTDASLETCL
jgi:hypothetical protein